MAKRMSTDELRQFAQVGAQARLTALDEERAALLAAFPELAGRGRKLKAVASTPTPKRRSRRTMSAAERKVVSARMKAYWAKRRAKKSA